MLVEFSVRNFRSIRDRVTLSLVAEPPRKGSLADENRTIFVNDKLSLLRSVVLYGANASGKSNILDSMGVFFHIIMSSAGWQRGRNLAVEPFRLRTDTRTQPSEFEIVFLLKREDRFVQYRYGFTATTDRVHREWLFVNEGNQREIERFRRDETGIHIGKTFEEGKGIEKNTRPNSLFLSTVAALNGAEANRIMDWIVDRNPENQPISDDTAQLLNKELYVSEINELICGLDMDISSLTTREVAQPPQSRPTYYTVSRVREEAVMPEGMRTREPIAEIEILSRHAIRDENGTIICEEDFLVDEMESDGTQKLIRMVGGLLRSIGRGKTNIVDEMDAYLHPHLTAAIVRLYHSIQSNPNGAQLIFATHDTNLLSNDLFRRDQIYLVQKDKQSGTMLYSLDEFKGVRQKDSYEREYLQGQFGAIPYLGDLEKIAAPRSNGRAGCENAAA